MGVAGRAHFRGSLPARGDQAARSAAERLTHARDAHKTADAAATGKIR
jgi:hypothetical protein